MRNTKLYPRFHTTWNQTIWSKKRKTMTCNIVVTRLTLEIPISRVMIFTRIRGNWNSLLMSYPLPPVPTVVAFLYQWVPADTRIIGFYLPRRRRPGTGDIATPPSVRPSVCPSVRLSVTFSFRTVTQKHIAVFSRNFAGTCTKSWGCAV